MSARAKAVAACRQPFELVSERGVDRGALLVDLAQILLEGARDHVAAFGELLHLAAHSRVDRGAALGEFRRDPTCSAAAMRSRPSASLRVWFSTAWSMPARASESLL